LDAVTIPRLRKQCQEQAVRYRELMHGDVTVVRQVFRKLNQDIRFFPVVREGRKTYGYHEVLDGWL